MHAQSSTVSLQSDDWVQIATHDKNQLSSVNHGQCDDISVTSSQSPKAGSHSAMSVSSQDSLRGNIGLDSSPSCSSTENKSLNGPAHCDDIKDHSQPDLDASLHNLSLDEQVSGAGVLSPRPPQDQSQACSAHTSPAQAHPRMLVQDPMSTPLRFHNHDKGDSMPVVHAQNEDKFEICQQPEDGSAEDSVSDRDSGSTSDPHSPGGKPDKPSGPKVGPAAVLKRKMATFMSMPSSVSSAHSDESLASEFGHTPVARGWKCPSAFRVHAFVFIFGGVTFLLRSLIHIAAIAGSWNTICHHPNISCKRGQQEWTAPLYSSSG